MPLCSKYVHKDIKHVKIVHVYGKFMFFITSGIFSAPCHSWELNSLKYFVQTLLPIH